MKRVTILKTDQWGANVRIEQPGHYPYEVFITGGNVVNYRVCGKLPVKGDTLEITKCPHCERELWLFDGEPRICQHCEERSEKIDAGIYQETTWNGEDELEF